MKSLDKNAALAAFLAATVKQDQDSEKRILKELDVLIAHAENDQLKRHFEHHKEETRHQIERLEKVCSLLEVELNKHHDNSDKSLLDKTVDLVKKVIHFAPETKCQGMKGILEDGQTLLGIFNKTPISDDVLIAASLRVEHFEIAAYEMIINAAEQLGLIQVAELLKESYEEEKSMAEKLMHLAAERKFLAVRMARL